MVDFPVRHILDREEQAAGGRSPIPAGQQFAARLLQVEFVDFGSGQSAHRIEQGFLAHNGQVGDVLHQRVPIHIKGEVDEALEVCGLLHLRRRKKLVLLIRGEPVEVFGEEVQFIQVNLLPIQHSQRLWR